MSGSRFNFASLPPHLYRLLVPLGCGLSMKEIAEYLGLSFNTVKAMYVPQLRKRTGLSTWELRAYGRQMIEAAR